MIILHKKGYIRMNKFTGWVKHWYRYKTDEPYIIASALIGAICLYASIMKDHKHHLLIYVLVLILIALWSLFRSVTFKKNYVRKFVKEHAFTNQQNGIDLGTGTGYGLIKLARDTEIGKVCGVEDKYQYTVQRLEKNATLERVRSKMNITTADIQNIPYEDKEFDVAMGISANGNQLSTPKKAVYQQIASELDRVVKQDGIIFMVNTPRMTKKYANEFAKHGRHVEYMHRRFEKFFNLRAIVVK